MNIDYAGIDLGYDTVKIAVGGNLESFPSLAKEKEISRLDYNSKKDAFRKSKMVIEVREDNKDYNYMVGDYVVNQLQKGGFDYDVNKFEKTSELAKLLAAFSLMYPDEKEIVVDTLVTGLPIRDYNQNREAMKNRFEKEFEAKITNSEGKLITVRYKFKNVYIIPQAVAALFNYLDSSNIDIEDEIIAIADIGGLTTDLVAFNRGELLENSAVSLQYGMSNVFDIVANEYNAENNQIRDAVIRDYDLINTGHRKASIRKALSNACDSVSRNISTEIKNKWRDFIDNIDRIVCVGGGADSLNEYLQSNLEEIKIDLAKDAQLYNVLGYQLRAKTIFEEKQ